MSAAAIPSAKPESQRLSESLDEIIARRAEFLTAYQDAAYAKRYTDLVARVRAAEAAKVPGATALTEAVARYYFKLLAVKDEYEVARLYAETDFAARVAEQFEGDYKLTFHLAPPVFNKPDPVTGEAKKSVYGPWMMRAFRVLAKLRRLPRNGARPVQSRPQSAGWSARYRAHTRRSSPSSRRAGAAQSCARGRARADSRAHTRLWARQGSARGRGEEEGSRAARRPSAQATPVGPKTMALAAD